MQVIVDLIKDPATAAVLASVATLLLQKWLGVTPVPPVPLPPGPAPEPVPDPTPAPNPIQALIRTVLLQVLQLLAGKLPPDAVAVLSGTQSQSDRDCCYVAGLAKRVKCPEVAKYLREKVLPEIADGGTNAAA